MRRSKLTVAALCALTLGTAGTFTACKKNPIDAGIEAVLDNAFAGYYEAGDGTQVEVTFGGNGFWATIRKVGSTVFNVTPRVGDSYMVGMAPTGKPGEYRGYITLKSGFLDWGTATLANGRMSIAWDKATDAIPAQASFNKIATPSTPSTPSNPGTPGGAQGDIELLYLKNLEGNEKSSAVYKVTVPSGAKKLVVKTFEEDIYGHNLGDLFVNFGSQPTKITTSPYLSSSDCGSVNPNREDEICTFTNPAAGTWYILLYGYHAYYATSLRVTYSK